MNIYVVLVRDVPSTRFVDDCCAAGARAPCENSRLTQVPVRPTAQFPLVASKRSKIAGRELNDFDPRQIQRVSKFGMSSDTCGEFVQHLGWNDAAEWVHYLLEKIQLSH